jgi:hypothetical protein
MSSGENKAHRHLAILLVGFTMTLLLVPGAFLSTTSAGGMHQSSAITPTPEKQPDSGTANLSDGASILDSRIEMRLPSRISTTASTPAAAIMSETFEGSWPALGWEVSDLSSVDGGEYLWDKRNCHSHTGNYGGWSVGGGAQGSALPCSGNYPNNTRSWAVYGPFDLRNAMSASLTFHLWGRTEYHPQCNFDFLFVGSSTDATNFSQGIQACGNLTTGTAGNGYHRYTLDLNSRLGQRQVWLAFVLSSDSSATDNGITIDDVTLDVNGSITTTPTVSPTSTPTPTVSPTSTSSPTASPTSTTATPTSSARTPTSRPAPEQSKNYLPLIRRDAPPAVTATPTNEPTVTPTPTNKPTATPTSTSEPTATSPAGSFAIDGSWEGTTSQGLPVFFDIANRSFTSIGAGYAIPGCVRFVLQSFTPARSIQGNTFSVSLSVPGDFILIEGVFDSSGSASGTIEAQGTCGSVDLTWTATKQ